MATENIKFKLELFATKWDKAPTCKIFVNDTCKWQDEVTGTDKAPNIIEFTHDCEEGKDYKLMIDRAGKDTTQTVVENGEIVKDQLLHIKTIEIDEINIGSLVFEGIYKPIYPEPWKSQQIESGNKLPETIKNVTAMGHNGTWTLGFSSPFYMWLLENLY